MGPCALPAAADSSSATHCFPQLLPQTLPNRTDANYFYVKEGISMFKQATDATDLDRKTASTVGPAAACPSLYITHPDHQSSHIDLITDYYMYNVAAVPVCQPKSTVCTRA
jgi:Zn-dependent M28 family amino/carboxypeptidase